MTNQPEPRTTTSTPEGLVDTVRAAAVTNNPAWAQLLGLCPLLAVSTTVTNALGLAFASLFVLVGANTVISLLRRWIAPFARLPVFVLVIATFTTTAVLVMQAYLFDVYQQVALFVQIIVTNCMILGRVEACASRQPPPIAIADAVGTGVGFAAALIVLAGAREILGRGTLLAGMDRLFGPAAAGWQLQIVPGDLTLLIVVMPPGAFIIAGVLLALVRTLGRFRVSERNMEDRIE